MKVLENHNADVVNELIKGSFNEKSIVFSDKSTSYVNISDYVETHITEKSNKQTTRTTSINSAINSIEDISEIVYLIGLL